MWVSGGDSGEIHSLEAGKEAGRREDSDVDASTSENEHVRSADGRREGENTGVIDFCCLYFMLKIGWYIQAI